MSVADRAGGGCGAHGVWAGCGLRGGLETGLFPGTQEGGACGGRFTGCMDDKGDNPCVGMEVVVNRIWKGPDQQFAEVLIGCAVNLSVLLNV